MPRPLIATFFRYSFNHYTQAFNKAAMWYALRIHGRLTDSQQAFEMAEERLGFHVNLFMPTILRQSSINGKTVIRRHRLLGHYLFLNHSVEQIEALRTLVPGMDWLRAPDGTSRQVVPDEEMHMFMAVAKAYGNQLPCYPIEAVDLEEGDLVEIIGGEFDGVKGVLQSQQGREGGRVVLNVGNLFLVATPSIMARHIRIIKFGRGNRHPYRLFDAHMTRALQALRHKLGGEGLTLDDTAALLTFTQRFAQLHVATVSQASTHATLMLVSYRALGDDKGYLDYLQRCRDLLPSVTGEVQRAQHLAMLYAATGYPDYRDKAARIVAGWQLIAANDRKKRMVTEWLHLPKSAMN